MKKFKSNIEHNDFDVLAAIKYCWDRGIYFYPVVIPNQEKSLKFTPKCRIEFRHTGKTKVGDLEYQQGTELYDKIRELYLHKHHQMIKTPESEFNFLLEKKKCINWNGSSCRFNCKTKCMSKKQN